MRHILVIHSHITSVMIYIYSLYASLRKQLCYYGFEKDEIIYKGYYRFDTLDYIIQYNHDTLLYILYTCLLKLINFDRFRTKETIHTLSLKYKSTTVLKYISNNDIKYTVKRCYITEDDDVSYYDLPKAFIAKIGSHIVTEEYNNLRMYMYNEIALIFMKVLLHIKYGYIPSDASFESLLILDNKTLDETVFKKYAPCS